MSVSASDRLITLNVAPALEDAIVDWLLEHCPGQGFTSFRADGHGSAQERLTVGEQVRGRQRRVEFRLVTDAAAADGIVARLEADFAGADVFYAVLPVFGMGHLGRPAPGG